MKKLFKLAMMVCACCLAVACSQTVKVTDPCDLLVPINPRPETNTYLVTHDRDAAVSIARHRGRYTHYCRKS